MNMILDLIFPEACVNCRNYTEDPQHPYICGACFVTIPDHKAPTCLGCNRQTSDSQICPLCQKDYSLDAVHVVSDYQNNSLKGLIHCVKYQFVADASESLVNVVSKFITHRSKTKKSNLFGSATIIVPVPLHRKRHNWRGFNQSELIARQLSAHYLLNLETTALIRTRDSKPQAEIDNRHERLANLKGSYKVIKNDNLANKDILLIDDVCTTGTTLNECAKALKEAGARSVVGLVIARG